MKTLNVWAIAILVSFGIARAHLLHARLEKVRGLRVGAGRGRAQHREDAAHRHVDVDVGRAVERVEDHNVVPAVGLLDRDGEVLLLGRDHARAARRAQRVAEDLVRDDVELLLVLALDVGRAREARQVGDPGAVDERRDLLAGRGDGGEDDGELGVERAVGLLLLFLERGGGKEKSEGVSKEKKEKR